MTLEEAFDIVDKMFRKHFSAYEYDVIEELLCDVAAMNYAMQEGTGPENLEEQYILSAECFVNTFAGRPRAI